MGLYGSHYIINILLLVKKTSSSSLDEQFTFSFPKLPFNYITSILSVYILYTVLLELFRE